MDFLIAVLVAGFIAWSTKSRSERARVALLAAHLRAFEIESLMQTLSEGYQRALGEEDAQRRQAIWSLLEPSERRIASQLGQLAQRLGQEPAERCRVLRWEWPASALLQLLSRVWPSLLQRQSFDLRALMALHAQAVARACQSSAAPASRAFTLLAELLLLQHSCHWFCKSRQVASARLLLRHQTSYNKVLSSVDAQTRRSYQALTGA